MFAQAIDRVEPTRTIVCCCATQAPVRELRLCVTLHATCAIDIAISFMRPLFAKAPVRRDPAHLTMVFLFQTMVLATVFRNRLIMGLSTTGFFAVLLFVDRGANRQHSTNAQYCFQNILLRGTNRGRRNGREGNRYAKHHGGKLFCHLHNLSGDLGDAQTSPNKQMSRNDETLLSDNTRSDIEYQ